MKIKIFQANYVDKIEEDFNKWTLENPTYEIVGIKPYAAVMYDLYNDQQPIVYNCSYEYTWTVMYNINKK